MSTTEVAPGIHRIPIPTPFAVGRVNCYLIADDPLTLIDTGPNSGTSLDQLEVALASLGLRVEDLELIVLTHQHLDHVGLLQVLSRRSGAEVAAFAPLASWLGDYASGAADDDRYAMAMLRRHGVPAEQLPLIGLLGTAFRAYGSGAPVTRPLLDGDTLALRDHSFTVRHRPGHSPSDLILIDGRAGLTVAGDHLLPHISSNPLISRPLGAPPEPTAPRPTPLADYIGSLRATRELPGSLFLPGHGDPFHDHVTLIDERLRLHRRRLDKLQGMLADGPRSGFELAQAMWGQAALTQSLLTLSEVLGHLDLMLAAGDVVELAGDPVRFARA